MAYLPLITLPLLPDDYLQLHLAERFISSAGWPQLIADPLYRSRATSLVLSQTTLWAFGFSPIALSLSSVALHMFNTWLVFGLRHSPLIGTRIAALAALVFAVRERHHEAVIWYAALPELLVFTFSLAAAGQWIRWLKDPQTCAGRWWAALVLFSAALVSKESAVAAVPILALLAWPYRGRLGLPALANALAPFAAAAAADAALVFAGAGQNQHFADGTFTPGAGFVTTLANSAARGFWMWGSLAALLLALFPSRSRRLMGGLALLWIFVSLLPYSFVSYMPRIPSRHHYLASVGFSLLIAAGMISASRGTRRWLLPVLVAAFAVHNIGYIWASKRQQFLQRAEPIEAVVTHAQTNPLRPVRLACFPGNMGELERALRFRLGEPTAVVNVGADEPAALSFCGVKAHR